MPCWALHLGPVASGTAPKSVVFCDSSPTWYVIIKNKLHNKMTIKNRFVINIEEIWLLWFQIFSHKELRVNGLWCSEQPNDKGMTRVMKEYLGLPWWLRGKNPPANAGDTDRFHPGSGKIPHATKQLSLRTTTEPVFQSPGAQLRKALRLGPVLCKREAAPWEAWALQLERSPCSPQLEKACTQNRRPGATKCK